MSKVTDFIEAKTANIKMNLDEFFNTPEAQKRLQSMYAHPIICKIMLEDNDYDDISEREFNDSSEVLKCFTAYIDIIATINMKVAFIPSKENFCMFMGWTTNIYDGLISESSEDIKSAMKMVNDYILESQIAAGQLGFASSSLTKFKAQVAGEHGFSLVTQKEQNEEDRKQGKLKSKEELYLELQKMGFNTNVELTNK